MKRRQAFTLIELLVVVAIIVVLLAILLPSLRSARDQAKAVTCLANLRGIGQSVMMYEQEYRYLPNSMSTGSWYNWAYKMIQVGLMPGAVGDVSKGAWTTATGTPFLGVKSAVGGEMKSPLHCPAVTSQDISPSFGYYTNAYGSPAGVMGETGTLPGSTTYKFMRSNSFESAADTIAAYDGTDFHNGSNSHLVGAQWGALFVESTKSSMNQFFGQRHMNRGNCLFIDGHAEPRRLMELTRKNCPQKDDVLP